MQCSSWPTGVCGANRILTYPQFLVERVVTQFPSIHSLVLSKRWELYCSLRVLSPGRQFRRPLKLMASTWPAPSAGPSGFSILRTLTPRLNARRTWCLSSR